ncbi:MFS transporter [Brachybacterium sp. DNPG3]
MTPQLADPSAAPSVTPSPAPAPALPTATAPAPSAGLPPTARRGLLVLAASTFLAVTTEVMPIGLLPQISTELGIAEGRSGMLVSLYAFLVMLLAVPLTSALRRVPGKHLLVATAAGYTLTRMLFALAPGFGMLAVARAIGGATHAVSFSVCIGYSTRLVDPSRAGRALALVSAGSSAGLILGSPLATALGSAVGVGPLALAAGGVMAAALLLIVLGRSAFRLRPA